MCFQPVHDCSDDDALGTGDAGFLAVVSVGAGSHSLCLLFSSFGVAMPDRKEVVPAAGDVSGLGRGDGAPTVALLDDPALILAAFVVVATFGVGDFVQTGIFFGSSEFPSAGFG